MATIAEEASQETIEQTANLLNSLAGNLERRAKTGELQPSGEFQAIAKRLRARARDLKDAVEKWPDGRQ